MAATIYEDLEVAIVAALAPIGAGGLVDVVLFPDTAQEFAKTFAKPRISVRYHSFTAGEQIAMSASLNPKEISIQIMFEAKATRGVNGINHLEVQAEAILQGAKFPNFKPLTVGPFTFGERNPDGIWSYNLIMKTEGVTLQAPRQFKGFPLIGT